MTDLLNKVHPGFKLNNVSYSFEELKEVAYSLVKEGTPFEISLGDFLLDWLSGSEILEVRTSGSTGSPKLIRLRRKQMINSARATGNFLALSPGDSALLCLPMEYIAGKMMLVRAMVLGLELHYKIPSSTPLEQGNQEYNFGAMTPMQLKNSISQIERIRKLIVGGSAVPEDLREELTLKKNQIYESFGMTETITHIALKKLSRGASEEHFKTLDNVRVTIDKRNCLVIEAPDINAEKIVTNDLVSLHSETEFKWLGRIDNMVNSGGIKLSPEQIEEKIKNCINTRFFVTGLPDEVLGEHLVLILEGEKDIKTIRECIGRLKQLEKFEIPKKIFCIPAFVLTKSGKIKRSETRALVQQ
ncbi:MAG: AMP-binding protein [Flavobacteriaceae bacterium]